MAMYVQTKIAVPESVRDNAKVSSILVAFLGDMLPGLKAGEDVKLSYLFEFASV